MSQNQENLGQMRGDHSERNNTKCKITKFILSKNGSVSEPDIRKCMEKNGISDRAGINKHLHQLKKEGCIKFFPAKKSKYSSRPGLPNNWDITKIEHLKNIRKNFPEIKMNNYEKSLTIVLRESGQSINTFEGLIIYIQLLLSASFFNICIETDLETLYPRVRKSYQCVKGFYRYPHTDDILNKCYVLYINRNPRTEMSKEEFREKIDEIAREDIEYYSEELILDMLEKRFPGLSKEPFLKIWKGHPPGKPTEIPEGMYLNMRDEDLETCMNYLLGLKKQEHWDLDTVFFDILQEHFLIDDILNNVDTSDEVEFARKTKEILVRYSQYQDHEEKVQLESAYLRSASEVIVKYKQPLIFGKTYNNADDAYQALENFYHGEL